MPDVDTSPSRLTPVRDARRRGERELFDGYRRTGDPATHEALVRRFLPLVQRLARQHRHAGEPFDDLVQVGSLGLSSEWNGPSASSRPRSVARRPGRRSPRRSGSAPSTSSTPAWPRWRAAPSRSTASCGAPNEPEGQHADFFPFEESGFAAAENAATLARLLPCLGARVQRTAA